MIRSPKISKTFIYTLFTLFLALQLSGQEKQHLKFISNLKIINESDSTQCVQHNPTFSWKIADSLKNSPLIMEIYNITQQDDSLIWQSDSLELNDTQYTYKDINNIKDGHKYSFNIRVNHNKTDWSQKQTCTFVMNTPPDIPNLLLEQNYIFRESKILLPFLISRDNQKPANLLSYQIRISKDSLARDQIIEVDSVEYTVSGDSLFFEAPDIFEENGSYFYCLRSFDEVEYSNWSNPVKFSINRINEPPLPFNLVSPNDNIILSPNVSLSWRETSDPDQNLGTGFQNYLISIATDSSFQNLIRKISVPPLVTTYQIKDLENHLPYFWKITAIDKFGLQTTSNQTFTFTLNYENSPPNPPLLISPQNNKVLKPHDFFIWKLTGDNDKYDKISTEIIITRPGKSMPIIKTLLSDSIMQAINFSKISGIFSNYDNSIYFSLNNLPDLNKLQDAGYYQLKINLLDNWGGKTSSNWRNSIFQFDDNINQAPNQPSGGFSPDSVVINKNFPVFSWSPSQDPDVADICRYQIMISRDPNFQTNTKININTKYGINIIKIKNHLVENSQYFWKVRSLDLSETKSQWSRLNTFWVNRINEPPRGPVEIINPRRLDEVNPTTLFSWKATTDPDPFDKINYIFEIDEKKDFSFPIIHHQINLESSDQTFEEYRKVLNQITGYTKLIDNELYYWRIMAIDEEGLLSNSPKFPTRIVFNSHNNPPARLTSGFSITEGQIVLTSRPDFKWAKTTDPDFTDFHNTINYEIQVSPTTQFSPDNTISYRSGRGISHILLPQNLAENKTYYYRVRAFDQYNSYAEWSPVISFIVNEKKEAPYKLNSNVVPKDSMTVSNLQPMISWQPVSDPDPDHDENTTSYIIQYLPSEFLNTDEQDKNTKEIKSRPNINSIKLPELEENKYYCYRIASVDPDNNHSDFSKLYFFKVNSISEPPENFTLYSPYNQQDSVLTNLCFKWKKSIDPDPGNKVFYYIYYGKDSLFTTDYRRIQIDQQNGDTIKYCPMEQMLPSSKYFWKVSAEDVAGNKVWGSASNTKPFVFYTYGYKATKVTKQSDPFILFQNVPNPFNRETKIKYEVLEYCDLELTIYNLLGKKIKQLAGGYHFTGVYFVYWNGTDSHGSSVPGGMYLCRLKSGRAVAHNKVILLR